MALQDNVLFNTSTPASRICVINEHLRTLGGVKTPSDRRPRARSPETDSSPVQRSHLFSSAHFLIPGASHVKGVVEQKFSFF